MKRNIDFFLNELINYFPGRVEFPTEEELYNYLTTKGIISVSNYLSFEDYLSYQNPKDLEDNINSHSSKTKFYTIYACSFFKKIKNERDLISLINDPDDSIRAVSIYTIGELKISEAASKLLLQIDNNKPHIVNEIIIALGKIGDPISESKINELLIKKEYSTQALLAIARLNKKDGLKTIVKYIKKGTRENKCIAIYASVYYNSKQLNEILLSQLYLERNAINENDEENDTLILNTIVYVLGQKRVEESVKSIIEYYVDKIISEKVAFLALLNISKKNIDVAISLLKDSDPPARLIGAKLLGEINNQSAVVDLIEAYNNEYIFTLGNVIKDCEEFGNDVFAFDDIFVLEELIKTIGELGGSDALITIDKACNSEHANVSEVANEALKKLIEKENYKILMSNFENVSDLAKTHILHRLIENSENSYTDIIYEFLNDVNKEISYLSALYLGKNEDNRAIGKLSEILSVKHEYSSQAKSFLEKMGF